MARIEWSDTAVFVRLGLLERAGALHGDVEFPRTAIASVRAVENPLSHVRGLRVPGTALPGMLALGTYRGLFGKDFAAATRERGVVFELTGAAWQHVVVSVSNPDEVAQALAPRAP
ncbi:MAG: hypothetical protein RL199_1092 [Pseudomonadota bacterium]|jgi:hypothetical protein